MTLADLHPRPGLRVLITAGASGIGRAMAEAFRSVEARVHICDVSPTALAELHAARPDIDGSLANVARPDEVEPLVAKVKYEYGGLDVLINNAGIAGPTARVEDVQPKEWDDCVAVNLSGQFYCARLAVPMLRESRGVMINISSVAGKFGYALRSPYAAAKWGVIGFTLSLAKELGADGVRVNAILPGPVEGERMQRVIEARAKAEGIDLPEAEHRELKDISLRRMTKASDVANMALYLCSPAGAIITGQALSVDGNCENI